MTTPDRTLSPPRHIAEVRTSPPQNSKYAAARARKSLAHAAEPAGPSRAAGGGIRLQCSGFHKRIARPSLSSARRKNSPTARSRLRRSVLAGRKGRARHRHRSGLKIPARPLSAPASPAVGGARPLLHWPASPWVRARRTTGACIRSATPVPAPAKKRKGQVPCQGDATRPADEPTTIYSPGSSISGGHPIHGYAHRVSLVLPRAAID